MKPRTAVLSLVVAVMLTGGFVTASAFTSTTVTRTADIDVVADDKGLITLNDGATGVVTTKANGQLAIDTSGTGADGVNGNAQFVFGSADNLTNAGASSDIAAHDYAFTIDLTEAINGSNDDLKLTYTDPDGNTDANVQFDVYTMGGTKVASASEESPGTITDPSEGTTYYVVLTIDTGAGSAETVLDSADDLSGTLTIETV